MLWTQRIIRRLRNLARRGVLVRDVGAEIRHRRELEERELRGRGHSPAEARRLARVRGVERHEEAGRDARGWTLLEDARQDVRYALRGIRRRPAFTAAAVLTLGIGIGSTTALYSVIEAVLVRALPYPGADDLARIHTSWEGTPVGAMSPAEYLDYRAGGDEVFSALGAYARGSATVAADGAAERVAAVFASADLFRVLAQPPLLGRTFTEEEELSGAALVVLSEGYWRRRFGGERDVVGRTISVNGSPLTVVGIAAGELRLPENLVEGGAPDLWVPLRIRPDSAYERGSHFLQGVARLREGVSLERAAATMEAIVARFSTAFPDDYEPENRFRATVVPLRQAVVREVRPALLAAAGAVVLVLLVAVANVAALLLARGEARQGEMALRTMLGARRPRLIRQLLVESMVLGAVGGVLGLAIAWAGTRALVAAQPPGLPRMEAIGLSPTVLLFAMATSLLTGLLFGLAPALRGSGTRGATALREVGGRTIEGGGSRLRQGLVVAEVALALTLLASAGLLARTMAKLMAVDTGVRIENVLATQFGVPVSRYTDAEEVGRFVADVVERVGALPEVEAAGAVTNLPLAAGIGDLGVSIPGRTPAPDNGNNGGNLAVDWQAATPGYDRAVGLRLVRGRWITDADRPEAAGVVVVNRTFAERYWKGGEVVGATLRLSAGARPEEARIVGVVEDVKHEGPAAPDRLQMYLPHQQFRFWHGGGPARGMTLVARTRPGASAAAEIRAAFREEDPEIGLGPFLTLEEAYRQVLLRPRILAGLFGAFSLVALVLAAMGVYGVTAYSVSRRRREFGIRLALGARGRAVAGSVVREGIALAGLGVLLGLGGAALLSRTLASVLFGVSPGDPLILAGGAAVLAAAALLASWLPARRAVRVDPAEALRLD